MGRKRGGTSARWLHCKAKACLGVFDHENEAWHLPVEAEPPTLDGTEPLTQLLDLAGGRLPKGSNAVIFTPSANA